MQTTAFDFIHSISAHLAVDTECKLFESMVAAGTPAQDYYDGYLNLHQYWFRILTMSSLFGPVEIQCWVQGSMTGIC